MRDFIAVLFVLFVFGGGIVIGWQYGHVHGVSTCYGIGHD